MKERRLKISEILETTTYRKEYNVLRYKFDWLYLDCGVCPVWNHCRHHKHLRCTPDRVFQRNWKSQRKTQYKS